MDDYKGIEYLRKKLNVKRSRVLLRYKYYDQKKMAEKLGQTMPVNIRNNLQAVMGWNTSSVDQLAERMVFHRFRNDVFDLNGIFNQNNKDIFVDDAILGAFISSCDFTYISADKNGFPRLQVVDGGNSTGIIDPVTKMLTEGYAVLKRDDSKNPIVEAYMIPGMTTVYKKGNPIPEEYPNKAPYALLVPIINKPDACRPFGRSRISRAAMAYQCEAERTLLRSELTSEFYSFPQKYVLGLSDDADALDKWNATLSSFLDFRQDENGKFPQVGQFQQQSMAPYNDQMKMIASLFAGETGLTADDLGFKSDNPTSQEAIQSSHERLRRIGNKAQRDFSVGLINTGYLAACVRDDVEYDRAAFYETAAVWAPIFMPDASMLSMMGDGIIKINQAIPGYINENNMYELTGIEKGENEITLKTVMEENNNGESGTGSTEENPE